MRIRKWVCSFLSGLLMMGLAACTSTGALPSIALPGAEGTRLPTLPPVVVTTRPKPPASLMPNATLTPNASQPTAATQTGRATAASATQGADLPTRGFTATAEQPSPTPASAAGWATYTSATLQLVVDYPSDWRPAEQAGSLTITSPHGAMIRLAFAETGSLAPEDFMRDNQLPNTRCTTDTNDYGLTMRICFDTLSRTYSAEVPVEWPSGARELLSLGMFRGGDLQIFDAVVRSVRPVQ